MRGGHARSRGSADESPGARRAGVYFPGLTGRGGAERLALVLALELARSGWQTYVITDDPVDPGELARDLGADLSSVTVVALGGDGDTGRAGLRELRASRRRARHASRIRGLRLDLFVNAKFRSVLPGCGRRNIYYCHFPQRLGVEGAHGARRLYLWAASVLERALVVRNAGGFLATYNEVWANSRFTARHVERHWQRDPVVVYPPCEPVEPADKEPVIAVVGRFQPRGENIPYKAQDVLLQAFATMTDLHEAGWRLVMVGGTSAGGSRYLADLRERAHGLPVDIVADATREQVREVLGRASLYWHAQGYGGDEERYPETQEHFGISTVEAMSAGAIPVVYGTAGPAEVVEGIDGVACWSRPEELVELTRAWAGRSGDETDVTRRRCRERAGDFDEAHFRRRVDELIGVVSIAGAP